MTRTQPPGWDYRRVCSRPGVAQEGGRAGAGETVVSFEMPHSPGSGIWRLADPKISLASFAGLFLAACLAAFDGGVDPLWLALIVLAVFSWEVAKNASGELVDYDSGTDLAIQPEDRSPFSGGKRVLVDGLLTRRETAWVALGAYVSGILLGLVIVLMREPRALWFGVPGLALAWFYHAPPARLSYRGLGEAAVSVAYGPLLVGGTYLVLRGHLPVGLLLASLPLGLLIGGFLLVNEFPDAVADAGAGKRTLVVRLGKARAARLFAAWEALAIVLAAVLPCAGFPRSTWLGLAAAIPAFMAARRVSRHYGSTQALIPAQGQALLAFILYSLGAGVGVLL